VFITARQFNQKPRIWVATMCRLAARDVPLGGCSSGTKKLVQSEVSPDGDSSPVKRFLEKFHKCKNYIKQAEYMHPFHHTSHAIIDTNKNNRVQLP